MGAINFINSNPAVSAMNEQQSSIINQNAAQDHRYQQQYAFDQSRAKQKAYADVAAAAAAANQPAAPAPVQRTSQNIANTATMTPGGDGQVLPSINVPGQAGAPPASPISSISAQGPAMAATPNVQMPGQPAAAPARAPFDLSGEMLKHPELAQESVATMSSVQSAQLTRQNAVSDKVFELAAKGTPQDIAAAKAMAEAGGLNIPAQFWNDPAMRSYFMGMIDQAHKLGLKGDQIPAFHAKLLELRQANPSGDPSQQMMQAAAAIPKGLAWKAPGAGGATGGGGVEGWKFNMWKQSNPSGTYEQYRNFAKGPSSDQRARLIMGALRAKDGSGDPLYANQAEAADAVDQALGHAAAPGGGEQQPAAGAPAGLPAGSKQIGTKDGKPVYEFKDAATGQTRRVVAQ